MPRNSVLEEPVLGSKRLFIFMTALGSKHFQFYNLWKEIVDSESLEASAVFIRDQEQAWYHLGLKGISENITETKEYLEKLINKYSPGKTIFFGASMGGFSALLFGALIGKCYTIAFSPQTFIDKKNRAEHNDKRWDLEIQKIYEQAKETFFDLQADLKPLDDWNAEIHFPKNCQLDAIHAHRMSHLKQVKLCEHKYKKHGLARNLRKRGILQEILKSAC